VTEPVAPVGGYSCLWGLLLEIMICDWRDKIMYVSMATICVLSIVVRCSCQQYRST